MSSLTTKTNRAKCCPSPFRFWPIECLVFPDGSWGITPDELLTLVETGWDYSGEAPDNDDLVRELRISLGRDYSGVPEYVEGVDQPQNVLVDEQFAKGLYWAAGLGNVVALDLLLALAQGSLDILFDAARAEESRRLTQDSGQEYRKRAYEAIMERRNTKS